MDAANSQVKQKSVQKERHLQKSKRLNIWKKRAAEKMLLYWKPQCSYQTKSRLFYCCLDGKVKGRVLVKFHLLFYSAFTSLLERHFKPRTTMPLDSYPTSLKCCSLLLVLFSASLVARIVFLVSFSIFLTSSVYLTKHVMHVLRSQCDYPSIAI